MTNTSRAGSRSVLADTGPLFAATDPKDQYHARARQDLHRLSQEQRSVVIPYPVVWECHSLVMRRQGANAAVSWLAEVRIKGTLVTPDVADYVAAMERSSRYLGQPISLFDAIVAVMSDRFGLPVWTFDHHFDVMRVAV